MLLKILSNSPDSRRKHFTKTLMNLKLLYFLLLVAGMQVSANGYGQKITIKKSNVSMKVIIKEIENQSGYQFFYEDKLLEQIGNVSINKVGATVQEILDQCLKSQPLTYNILDTIIIIKAKAPAVINSLVSFHIAPQNNVITGMVKDADGIPLSGVSVILRGTKKGTSSNADGSFSIDAKTGDILEFSMVGYKKKNIMAAQNGKLAVVMTIEVATVNDVVVVGFATQRKSEVTGAVTQIGGEVLENKPLSSISEGLQGAIPNLNITNTTNGGAPGASMNINIRGFTGLGTSGSPLIVVDGVPENNMDYLDPNDIETISVLKDAASSSIYGSRAPYGVVLITTKKGKKNKPMQVTYNNVLSLASPINLPQMVNSITYANFLNEAATNAGTALPYTTTVLNSIQNYKIGDSTTTVNPVNNQFLGGVSANDNINWFDVYFKNNSPFISHNLNIRGGSDKMTYYLSGIYSDKEGAYNFSTDSYKKYNVLANITADVKPWLTISIKTGFTGTTANSPNVPNGLTGGNNIHQIARIRPTEPLFNPDGNYSVGSNIPVFLYGGRNITQFRQTEMNGSFNIHPIKGFEINGSYNYLFSNIDNSSQIKTVSAYDANGVAFVPSNWGSPNSYGRTMTNRIYKNINLYSSYERRFGEHYLKLLVGLQTESNTSTGFSASNSNLYTDLLPSLSLTSSTTARALSDAYDQWASQGIFSRLNYNFKEKYLLELNLRRDGSSRFPTYNKYGVFPSMSAGYIFSKEAYWKTIEKYVNTFKIRGSYGSLGDQSGIGSYSFVSVLPNYTSGNYIFGTAASPYIAGPTTLTSSNFTWANPTTLDFGVDATFLKNRLTFTADWYRRKVNDLLGSRGNYPAVLGIAPPVLNNASIQTDGYEVLLNWKDNIKSFQYSITASLSDYQGKVLSYNGNPNGLISDWIPGRKMGEIWGFETVGLIQDSAAFAKNGPSQKYLYSKWRAGDVQYKDLNGNDSIEVGNNTVSNPGDKKVIGNTSPRYQYGFTLNASWKNFDISIFLQGVAKRDVFINSNMFWGFEPTSGNQFQNSVFKENLNRWTPSTPGGYFPKYYYQSPEMAKNTQVQSRYLQNAGYMRIKNVRVGYSLPKPLMEKIGFQRLYIYAAVQNLATFTKLTKTFDPELALGDGKIYPLQRTFSTGINLSF